MDCDDFREALSARLDNEEDVVDADQSIDVHLEYCRDCAFWYDAAALITRRTRTTAAVAWPNVSDAVLAQVGPGGDRALSKVRLALGVVGALQCGVGLTTLATLPEGGFETGPWQLALGVAFGAVAARRSPSAALTPLLGTLVAAQSIGQLSGVLTGTGTLSLVLSAIGLVLVVLLGRMPPIRKKPAPPTPAANRLRRPRATEEPPDDRATVTYLTIGMTQTAKSA